MTEWLPWIGVILLIAIIWQLLIPAVIHLLHRFFD